MKEEEESIYFHFQMKDLKILIFLNYSFTIVHKYSILLSSLLPLQS